MSDVLGFFKKNGRVIPIRAAGHAARSAHSSVHHIARASHVIKKVAQASASAAGAKEIQKHGFQPHHKAVKVNRTLDMTGLGLSVASGVVAAATFTGGWKKVAGGAVASHVIDAAGISANVASVAGRGHLKQRASQAAKQEARNFAVGNLVYGVGLVAVKKNREAMVGYAKSVLDFGRKALKVAKVVE